MKKIFIITGLALAMLIESTIMAQNRYVWLHGLFDNEDCWTVYNNAFTPGVGTRLYYSSHNSIEGIANRIVPDVTIRPNTIIIGHSLGGLVAREIESRRNPNIRGIITIGTPHQGSFVQNSIAAGKQKEFIKSNINRINYGIDFSSLAFGGTLNTLLPLLIPTGVRCLEEKLLTPYLNGLADGSQQCEKDMQVGSAYMNTIDSRRVNVPILTFAAEEDRWAISRLAWCGSKKGTLQTDANANTDGKFDMPGYNYTKTTQSASYGLTGVHTSFAVAHLVLGWSNPASWVKAGLHVSAGTYWLTVGNYITSGLDYDHSVLVGAYAYQKRTYCYERLVCDDIGRMQKLPNPDDCYTEYVCQTYMVATPCSHDGIVSTYSQQLDKAKGNNVIWRSETIKGVNHMEEFNHKNTREEFRKAIEDGYYHPFFRR
jgi:hypothetical protein